jgi:N-acetylmuramic acid 6-phosphate etherase
MIERRTVPSPTEARNPRSRGLDRQSTMKILRVLNREEACVAPAVARELPAIARAVDIIVAALRRGGRLFYVGAGTSGRLAALDASECPPTFGTPPEMVQAIIAGGPKALTQAVEGAEDAADKGARDLAARRIRAKDVVVGLATSGSTPYVLAALKYARQRGAATIGVTAHRRGPIRRVSKILIAPDTGPEAIIGSTRLKAGTAQKMVLNMLSTATMVRLGDVYDNWMVNVALTNQKLRRRGLRILEQATGASLFDSEHALRQAGHDLRVALVILKSKVDAREARRRLEIAGGNLRKALREHGQRKKTRRTGR